MPEKNQETGKNPAEMRSDTTESFFSLGSDDAEPPLSTSRHEQMSTGHTGEVDESNESLAADDTEPSLFLGDERQQIREEFPQENYLVLARRYRPQTFDDLVGQEHVREALKQAILEHQVAHAYLFSGPRGTGKTSTARILAKALNCQDNGLRPDPCGRCASCRAIAAGTSLDVVEIDAASNTGVDNIRDLKTGAVLAPFSRYKVYIVDEVHMLSMQAFNALLKTLEEPPPRVIFILATTELHKVPATIVSRCQCFQFRRFTTREIVEHLDRILEKEARERHIKVEPEEKGRILELIARAAEGGMRDAQVALDQVLVLCRERLDYDTVRRFLGGIQSSILEQFIRGILDRESEQLLLLLDDLISRGLDLERFVKNLAEFSRNLLVLQQAGKGAGLVDVTAEQMEVMTELAARFSTSRLVNLCHSLVRLADAVKTSSSPRFLLELEIVRLTRLDPEDDLGKLVQLLKKFEMQGSASPASIPTPRSAIVPASEARSSASAGSAFPAGGETASAARAGTEPPSSPNKEEKTKPTPAEGTRQDSEVTEERLPVVSSDLTEGPIEDHLVRTICTVVTSKHSALGKALSEVRGWQVRDNFFVITIDPANVFLADFLKREKAQEALRETVRQVLKRDFELRVEFESPVATPSQKTAETASNRAKSPVADKKVPVSASSDEFSGDAGRSDSAATVTDDSQEEGADETIETENADEAEDHFVDIEAILQRYQPPLKGSELKRYLDEHPDVAHIVDKCKQVFNITDDDISLKRQVIED
jgi:DNA polymerase-3 subunit gamma/tau